jgi:hypothetical protein
MRMGEPCSPVRETTEREGLAEPIISRRRQQTASRRVASVTRTGATQDTPGVLRRACGESSIRNRRGPPRQLLSERSGTYKPKAKWCRVERESEGFVVPVKAGKLAGGKGPYFGHVCVREVSARAWS